MPDIKTEIRSAILAITALLSIRKQITVSLENSVNITKSTAAGIAKAQYNIVHHNIVHHNGSKPPEENKLISTTITVETDSRLFCLPIRFS